jgi:hypothetical protein
MAKQKKDNSTIPTQENQELYTITPLETVETIHSQESSNQPKSNVHLEQTIQKPTDSTMESNISIEPNTSIIQTTDIETSLPTDQVELEKTIKKEVKYVYEVKYIVDKKEYVFYTYDIPELIDNTIVLIKPFGRKDLREVVLGKKEVKAFCKVDINEEAIKIDLLKGVLIKIVEEHPWMSLGQDETQRLFDQEVLSTYRQLSSTIKTFNTQQTNIGEYPVGNIPVNRPRIKDL